VLGIDGHYVNSQELRIAPEHFRGADLAAPFHVGRRFDVAMSLEVAEHLPTSVAASFVTSLVELAPAVLFSAAVPGQGGVGHINEQWPWYWKTQFARLGYLQLDPFRRLLWGNAEVAPYYQQNLYLYVDPSIHQSLIDRIGVPDQHNEMTLVRTSILKDALRPDIQTRLFQRVRSAVRRVFRCGVTDASQ
jgi:hypothetical protein